MPDPSIDQFVKLIEHLRVEPGRKVNLAHDYDSAYKAGWARKRDGKELLELGVTMMAEYQERLAAQDTYGLLVVLPLLGVLLQLGEDQPKRSDLVFFPSAHRALKVGFDLLSYLHPHPTGYAPGGR